MASPKLATARIEHVCGDHDQYLNQPLMTRSMHGIPILMPILTVTTPILTVTAVWSVHRRAQTRYNRVGEIWCRHMVYGASAMSSATVKSRSLLTTDVQYQPQSPSRRLSRHLGLKVSSVACLQIKWLWNTWLTTQKQFVDLWLGRVAPPKVVAVSRRLPALPTRVSLHLVSV